MKGSVSAQKALQGSEMETRDSLGRKEENSFSPTRVINLPYRQINDFFTKRKQKKIELVARPEDHLAIVSAPLLALQLE